MTRCFSRRWNVKPAAREAAHGVCFLVVAGFAVYAAVAGHIAGGIWLLVIGVVCQVYPMLLQRYHRPRWRRALTMARNRSS